jgi:aspartate carbamoyltransferase catalytic subunit
LARAFPWTVINAGDGINEHPSQALLDMLTLKDHFKSLEGLHVGIVGDVAHSRVAHSNIFGLHTLGAKVTVAGPGTMCRSDLSGLPVEVCHTIDEVIDRKVDALMMLRIQRERLGNAVLPSAREYAAFYGLNLERLQKCRPELIVMHPGPINRGVELAADVADSPRSVILDQVANGIAVRMALMFLLLGGRDEGA